MLKPVSRIKSLITVILQFDDSSLSLSRHVVNRILVSEPVRTLRILSIQKFIFVSYGNNLKFIYLLEVLFSSMNSTHLTPP